MILVKATAASEAGEMPEASLMAAMGAYHEELAKAGVLLDATGLQPTSKGWRIRYSGGQRSVIDGPFADTQEVIAGYTLIQVRSREEAMEWARRFPAPFGENAMAKSKCGNSSNSRTSSRVRSLSVSVNWKRAAAKLPLSRREPIIGFHHAQANFRESRRR